MNLIYKLKTLNLIFTQEKYYPLLIKTYPYQLNEIIPRALYGSYKNRKTKIL